MNINSIYSMETLYSFEVKHLNIYVSENVYH